MWYNVIVDVWPKGSKCTDLLKISIERVFPLDAVFILSKSAPSPGKEEKIVGEIGRPRMFKTPEELAAAWEWYKAECDNQMVLTHDFSAKNSEFVSKELKRAITYTIEGFCVYIGISRQSFYDTYVNGNDPEFADIVTRIREACEVDARKKFELGLIPSQLAGLWMSKHGYSTKTDNTVTGALPVVISGGDDLED